MKSENAWSTTIESPLPREWGTEEPHHLTEIEIAKSHGETILVVDDEPSITTVTSLVLGHYGYKVLTADNGTTALALYQEHANEINVVLTDVMMPGMDGVSLSRALKQIDNQVTIVASTGYATESREAELRALGVNVILRKPYNAKTLVSTVSNAIYAA